MTLSAKRVTQREAEGTVSVSFSTQKPREDVWRALTDTDALKMWFGELSAPLEGPAPIRLDFGDGDFFSIEDVRLSPPTDAGYAWRFMGIGPRDSISWVVEDGPSGCVVTVADREPGRRREDASYLRYGWLDFTDRLCRFLDTGQSTRYDWRRELDVTIEVDVEAKQAWSALFDDNHIHLWLPVIDGNLRNGSRLVMHRGAGPRSVFSVSGLQHRSCRTTFELTGEGWLAPTRCELVVTSRRTGSLLSVSQTQWDVIQTSTELILRERQAFADLWIEALTKARAIAESADLRVGQ